jgi:O-antigen/teichoic acid export membrane protein
VLLAALCLGVAGAALGMGVWALLKNSAMSDFSLGMAVALMCALPFALAWWIVPAIPLARERFETYALLTVSGPVAVLVLCPALALAAGETGAVIGFAAGWAVGGLVNAIWAVRYARLPEARGGPEHGVREAGGFGARAWVNDLFQLINLRPDLFILSAYYGTTDTGVYAVTVSITSLVWIVSQPLASVVLPRNAMVFASADPGLSPAIPEDRQGAVVRHAVLISAAAALLVVPILAIAPLVWGPDFDRTLGLGLILLPGVALLGVGRVMVAAFTGEGAANEALFVGLVSFPLTFVAFLLVIPDHGSTGAAIVSCCSYVATSLLAAYLFLRARGHSARAALVPRAEDLRDYTLLARRGLDALERRRFGVSQ